MNDILTYDEKQIVLYFKGHFPVTNMMDDLRILVEPIYGNGLEHTSDRNIYEAVMEIFFKLRKSGHIKIDLQYFMESLFLRSPFELLDEPTEIIDRARVVNRMRHYIAHTKAEGLNLGKADEKLLAVLR